MLRRRIDLVAPLILALLSTASIPASAQSTGFAEFELHAINGTAPPVSLAVSRMFLQTSNGPQEIFSAEFAPGTHTLSSIEAIYNDCRLSASNVTFTITAGKWTLVDVPVTYRDCSLAASVNVTGDHNSDGGGTLNYSVLGNNPFGVANCTVVGVPTPPYYAWTNFHACQGTVAYGALVTVTATPGAHSLGGYTDTFIANTNESFYSGGVAFLDTLTPHPNGISAVTDVEIKLVSGSVQGFVANNVFRIVNHGPNNALGVRVDRNEDEIFSDSGDATISMSIADGWCDLSSRALGCFVNILPAGDSTTLTIRYHSVPSLPGDTASDNLPGFAANCGTVTVSNTRSFTDTLPPDPNPSNNTAHCTSATVPVTVVLGGATPTSRTVSAGASDVAMLEFLLTPAIQQTVTAVIVSAAGSGNDQADVSAVKLYLDRNANGAVDAGDSVIASGTFAANDGTVSLIVNPGLSITAPTALLVTYSFSVTVAQRIGGTIVLAFLPLFFIPAVRKRKTVLAMLLVMLTSVAVVSCGGDSTGPKPGGGSVTFKSTVSGVTTTTGSIANLSVSGATITINK